MSIALQLIIIELCLVTCLDRCHVLTVESIFSGVASHNKVSFGFVWTPVLFLKFIGMMGPIFYRIYQ